VVIRQLQEMFDRGERPSLSSNDRRDDIVLDVHTVASLLKSYLRELPEPLVPYEIYEQVMMIVTREMPTIGEHRAAVKLGELLAQQLSPANYNTLQFVCQFLWDVARCSDSNKMTSSNLATVFAQCFVRPSEDDPGLMLATSANRTVATQVFDVPTLFCVDCLLVDCKVISWPAIVWGPATVMVRVVCLSHVNISETKQDRRMVTRKLKLETGLPDSESAIRFRVGTSLIQTEMCWLA